MDSLADREIAAWVPTGEVIARANVTAAMRQLGLADYSALHRWSVENRPAYWELAIGRLDLRFRRRYEKIVDLADPIHPRWLVGARMNIVDSCFAADESAPAVIESDAAGGAVRVWTYGDLRRLTGRVANGLRDLGLAPGDAVGVVMPMTARAVAIYLAIVAAGTAAVSVADSFAAEEIAARLKLANAKLLFTNDIVPWGAERLRLYEKLAGVDVPAVVVSLGDRSAAPLRAGDLAFDAFLGSDDRLAPVDREPGDPITILFSSGTTAEPKAIPWDHTTPIKCAADGHFHHDLHPGDVACWPTNLGWMMGPWLIFAALLNRATIALYAQAPTEADFGTFVGESGVTMLGVVPSLVRAWRQSGCMTGVDWTNLRVFSSSGECSNPADMMYLMRLAGGRPVIEYCGGTEIGGGYVTGTVVQPCIPSTFTTPALGLDFVLLDAQRLPADKGEVFIIGPSIGLSTRLLKGDHDAMYFGQTPLDRLATPMRRHGDELERLPDGYYRVVGRSDDTMNLGGIKVGCAEIERVVNQLPGVAESAAIAATPPGGGPSRLVVFLVPVAGNSTPAEVIKPIVQQAIRAQLNPLFHVDEIRMVNSLPRTASNKIMRRQLRVSLSV